MPASSWWAATWWAEVKAQMKRMDPSFSEKSLELVELDESSTTRMVTLR